MSSKCEAFVTGRCWVCMEWPWWCVMSHLSYEINWPCVESIVHCSLVLLTQIDLQLSYVCLSVIIVQQNEVTTAIPRLDAEHGDLCGLEYYGHSLYWLLQKDSLLLISQQRKRQWYLNCCFSVHFDKYKFFSFQQMHTLCICWKEKNL
jgi:hypothetical protein